jgi:hypothetical protein
MIYEFRTYRVVPRSVPEVERIFGEAYAHRKKYSELTAFWHTEIGPLNEVVHVWAYADLGERSRIRAEAAQDPHWPPKIRDYIVAMRSEIVAPFPFLPAARPAKVGPIFELRYYTYKLGAMPQVAKNWEAALPASEAFAARPRGRGRVRPGQRLRPCLGLREPRSAHEGPQRGDRRGHLAAARRRQPRHAGKHDSPAGRILAAALETPAALQ